MINTHINITGVIYEMKLLKKHQINNRIKEDKLFTRKLILFYIMIIALTILIGVILLSHPHFVMG